MAKHLAPKQYSPYNTYALIMAVTLAVVGSVYLLPSYADAPPVVPTVSNGHPYKVNPILPALDLGDK